MQLALSYAIEFGVQTVFMMGALWVMIRLQSLNYTFLGLLICAGLSSAADIIPYFGHYLAVPTLYVCVARMTRADVYPDAVFTVVVAYALTFCMNLFLLGAMLGDLRPSADGEFDEITSSVMAEPEAEEEVKTVTRDQTVVTKSNSPSAVALKPKASVVPAPASKLSEATLKSITLKGLNIGSARPSAILSDGKRTFTLGVGESWALPTPDGPVTVKCERVAENTAVVTLNGQAQTLTIW